MEIIAIILIVSLFTGIISAVIAKDRNRDQAGVKHSNLSSEIQEVIDSRNLPHIIAESIDAIRNIGNFAAHPIKSTNTGEIVEVEVGEAEWTIDVLDTLIDYYIVQPSIIAKRKAALNQKLSDAGKPDMK